jgi:hypothetical protein
MSGGILVSERDRCVGRPSGHRATDSSNARRELASSAVHSIENVLLPSDPRAAFEMLTHLIEHDEEIAALCYEDDFGASQVFEHACELLLKAMQSLPAADTEPVLARLVANEWRSGLRERLVVYRSGQRGEGGSK